MLSHRGLNECLLLLMLTLVAAGPRPAYPASGSWDARGIAVQRNGQIVVVAHQPAGSSTSIVVTRLTRRGQPDHRFGAGSRAYVSLDSDVDHARVAIDRRRRIVVFVRHASGVDFTLLRLTPGGQLDASFGSGGRIEGSLPAGVADFAVDGKDRIVVAGTTRPGVDSAAAAIRYLGNGAPDTDFGIVSADFGTGESGRAVAVDRRNRIVLAATGGLPSDIAVFRITEAGLPDLTFGMGGGTKVRIDGQEPVFDVTVSRRSEPVVAAYSSALSQTWLALKFDRWGFPLSTFSEDGFLPIPGTESGDPDAIAVDSRGRVLLAGHVLGAATVARVTPQGVLDPKFGAAGLAQFPAHEAGAGIIETWYSMALAAGGRILLAGTHEESGGRTPMVAQLRPDGLPDTRFGSGGLVVLDL